MFVDLTMPFGSDTPVYPGDPAVELTEVANLNDDGYLVHTLKLGTHSGTHIDVPAHMIDRGASLGAYGLDRFTGPGRLLDIRDGKTPDLSQIMSGDIVLLRTDMSNTCHVSDYYHRVPNISEEVVHKIVRTGIKIVGIDAGSIDNAPFNIHKTLLAADVLIIENLINLNALVDVSFEVIALPLRLDCDGAPVRVIARLV